MRKKSSYFDCVLEMSTLCCYRDMNLSKYLAVSSGLPWFFIDRQRLTCLQMLRTPPHVGIVVGVKTRYLGNDRPQLEVSDASGMRCIQPEQKKES